MNVHGQTDILLVRRDGNLGGLHTEFQIASLQIVGAQRLQVGIELVASVAVGLGVPAHPVACVLVEQVLERRFLEGLVAHNVDFVDLGRLTFGDGEGQVHSVALDRRHRGHHFSAIQAAVDVLALELLLGAISQCLVERTAIGQAHVTHGLEQSVLVELLGAGKVHLGNGGTLFHNHHQHIAIGFEAHVLEQTQSKQ